MIDWELNNNPAAPNCGDLVYGDFVDHTVSNIDGLVQRLSIRLQVFLGEWFLDTDRGVPYFQQILEKGTSYDQVSDALKLVIVQTPDVNNITSFTIIESELTPRKITITFSVSSVFGEFTINNFTVGV